MAKATRSKETEAAGAVKKPAPKATAQKPERVEEVYLQFGADEWRISDLQEKAAAAYAAEGHRASAVKKLALYVKPEERKAYYVVNDKTTGSFNI